ncbi:WbqC family protein [Flavobacteriaceae bacterium 14752]|uniref:WbqC family protein n=1 Tax=Mesohalobacter salilacus TaxID=2491711 RepID=UPI000F63FE93|nr:hypothetical protein EIG84_01530 [Flavobacteriaceae bacterium 14752]
MNSNNNSIAVMQPYIFPYIGYFQMIAAVDKFVFYDDVNFIKQGWINRNRIKVAGKDFMFTIPLDKPNSFTKINKTLIKTISYEKWRRKILRTINQNYKKAPYFNSIYPLIYNTLNQEKETISELSIFSVKTIAEYLDLNTHFIISSEAYQNSELDRQQRILDICSIEKASLYINAIGGKDLYNKKDFLKQNVELRFINSRTVEYNQFSDEFIPWLSIIDVLMFNSKEKVKDFLNMYELF